MAFVAAAMVVSAVWLMAWLLAPLWRPRLPLSTIPPAAIGRASDPGAPKPRRPLTAGETVRIVLGFVAFVLFVVSVISLFEVSSAVYD